MSGAPSKTPIGAVDGPAPHDAMASGPTRVSVPAPSSNRRALSFIGILLLLAVLWEGMKLIGGDPWRIAVDVGAPTGVLFTPPLSFGFASDLNMPHLWDIAAAFLRPARRN